MMQTSEPPSILGPAISNPSGFAMTVLISDKNVYNAEPQVLGVMSLSTFFQCLMYFSKKIFNERAYDFLKARAKEIVSVLKV